MIKYPISVQYYFQESLYLQDLKLFYAVYERLY